MRSFLMLPLAFVAALGSGSAQCFKIAEVNTEKPEGQLFQQIDKESDEAKKLALMEKFAADFPKTDGAGWVLEQMQAAYAKANNYDKVIETGGKIMALAPDCVEGAQTTLKAAEAKKDPDLVKTWAGRTSEAAAKITGSPKPSDADAADAWTKRVDYAKQVNTYTEYSVYAAALQTTDPKKKAELLESLQQRNPASEYLAKSWGQLFLAYRQSGENDKALALAEKVLEKDQSDEDMLLVVASDYLGKKKDPDKVHAYCAKTVEVVSAKPKPDGVSDADWEKLKTTKLGAAHFMSGALYFTQNKFPQADKELREALPLIDANQQMKAEALYYLGFSNYKMEKVQEAANFYRACAAITSRYQATAKKNLGALKTQYSGVK